MVDEENNYQLLLLLHQTRKESLFTLFVYACFVIKVFQCGESFLQSVVVSLILQSAVHLAVGRHTDSRKHYSS
jgi:hypothetical protein